MAKKYAKNPSELTDFVIDNPEQKQTKSVSKPKKDPRRVAAGKKAWRTRQRRKKRNKMSKRSNPTKEAKKVLKTGRKKVVQSVFAVGGSFAAAKLIGWAVNKYGSSLSGKWRNAVALGTPVVAGSVIATYYPKNELAQGAATGMIISSVSSGVKQLMDKVVPQSQEMSGALVSGPEGNTNNHLADAAIPSAVVVTEDGRIWDMQGNEIDFPEALLESNAPGVSNSSASQATASIVETPSFEEQETY